MNIDYKYAQGCKREIPSWKFPGNSSEISLRDISAREIP